MDPAHDFPDPDDDVWRALANPIRRRILDALRDGPCSTGAVVAAVGLGRHVVVQHLAVLRAAGLVLVEPRGRRRLNHLNAVPIQRIHARWVSQYERPWAETLLGLKDAVERAAGDQDSDERGEREVG